VEETVLLELEHVAKQYEAPGGLAKIRVLRDISIQVRQGESIAVIGPSGTGKSTLLNIMGTLDRPSSGTVRLKGRALSDLSERELSKLRNRDIGFVFQLHHLLPQCTVLENVLLPTLPAGNVHGSGLVAQRAERLLERVGLGSHLMHRPGQLSGGECQRVAVVRALINGPGLVLADEPTGSLDRDTSEKLAELLVEINSEEGAGLIVVTHSMELASRMDRLFLLQDGVLNTIESKP
jgi:lipoprotein-releasing system ATP-binding protein